MSGALSAEEAAIFGLPAAAPEDEWGFDEPAALAPGVPFPETAPASDPGIPSPKGMIVDVQTDETDEQAKARHARMCQACGDPEPKPDHGATCPLRPVNAEQGGIVPAAPKKRGPKAKPAEPVPAAPIPAAVATAVLVEQTRRIAEALRALADAIDPK